MSTNYRWLARPGLNKVMSNNLAYALLKGTGLNKVIWNKFFPPTSAFIVLRLTHNGLPTNDNLRKRGCMI